MPIGDRVNAGIGRSLIIDVLGNDFDGDGEAINLVTVGSLDDGSTGLGNGKVLYSPNEAFEGLDTFTYVPEAAKGEQVTGVVEVNVLAEPPPRYLDGDFVVDGGGDVERFSDAFKSAEGDGSFGSQFDFNGDGRVHFTDLLMFALILHSQG